VLGFDVLKDPIVGYLSDRSRCGHRVPWIASGALILAVAMVAMFAGLSWQGNALWVGL
jgi:GPH family glycoside/pentoside/hexuronide:cation symporter